MHSKLLLLLALYLTNGTASQAEYESIPNQIHSNAVQSAILNLFTNPLQPRHSSRRSISTYGIALSQLGRNISKVVNTDQSLIKLPNDSSGLSYGSGETYTSTPHKSASRQLHEAPTRPDFKHFVFFYHLPALSVDTSNGIGPPTPEPTPT